MKVATTIQVGPEEDKEISRLKEELGLPTKKDVVREGLKALRQILQDQSRRKRLQAASLAVRKESAEVNREWSRFSTITKTP